MGPITLVSRAHGTEKNDRAADRLLWIPFRRRRHRRRAADGKERVALGVILVALLVG